MLDGTTPKIQHRKWGPNSVCVSKGASCKPDITRVFFGWGLHFGNFDIKERDKKSAKFLAKNQHFDQQSFDITDNLDLTWQVENQ